ncbi:hypothetical protein FRC19_000161 [Serendipita sp. 401]|nr:hypothetical protein FRC19_000161 [Serendipita sp. 401]
MLGGGGGGGGGGGENGLSWIDRRLNWIDGGWTPDPTYQSDLACLVRPARMVPSNSGVGSCPKPGFAKQSK